MLFLPFLYIFLFVGLIFLFRWLKSPERKGKKGEKRVQDYLAQLSDEYTILNDIVFQNERGTAQIDHIVVSKYGIFTIETKNYRGDIYGNDDRTEWTQMIITKVRYRRKWWKEYTYVTKNHLYNPVKQSFGHAYRIKEELTKYPDMYVTPIVTFVGDCNLTGVNTKHHVVYGEDLAPLIRSFQKVRYNEEVVQYIIDTLLISNVRDTVKNKEHVNNIKNNAAQVQAIVNSGKCPRCGGNLVLRKGRYSSFYGCSNYPNCKFTSRI